MKVRQCELVNGSDYHKVVWLDAEKDLKKGHIVIGKDKEVWRIEIVYSIVMELDELHTDWEVGGLP